MFDKGIRTITADQHVAVASEVFTEWGAEVSWLKRRQDQPLIFHAASRLRPDPRQLACHREHVFEQA